MSGRRKTDFEDNFYRRAQLEELIREEFPDLKVYETDEGREFFIHNPQAQPDELVETIDGVTNQIELAKAMIEARNGEGSWQAFKDANGQSMFVLQAFTKEARRLSGETPVSGIPTP